MGCFQYFQDSGFLEWIEVQYFQDSGFLGWIEVQYFQDPRFLEALRSNNMDLDWLIGGIEVQLEELFDQISKIEVQNVTFLN